MRRRSGKSTERARGWTCGDAACGTYVEEFERRADRIAAEWQEELGDRTLVDAASLEVLRPAP
jgi:hypothetical protein